VDTTTTNERFVASLINDIIKPGTDDLMDSRYFRDLRAGKLTTRRIQGFTVQHYLHNMGILKAFALGAAQHAADSRTFMAYATGMSEELTHPNMNRKLGKYLGLTDADFDNATPVFGSLIHTAVCIHGMYLANVAEMRANALSNESMVQRYATEFNEYLAKEPYGIPEDAREFFITHMGADIEHTNRAGIAIAQLADSDEDKEKVTAICKHMAKLKRGKFDSIYEEYS
jgi:pyrroloquinoline quinone (PQQ) biosynthesis protein C